MSGFRNPDFKKRAQVKHRYRLLRKDRKTRTYTFSNLLSETQLRTLGAGRKGNTNNKKVLMLYDKKNTVASVFLYVFAKTKK